MGTSMSRDDVIAGTDAYFETTRRIVTLAGDKRARYGLFMRRSVRACLEPVVRHLTRFGGPDLRILHRAPEGTVVPGQTALLVYEGSFAALVELETSLLQRTGIPCVAAANAAAMALALPRVAFIAMHARHCAGDDMVRWCEYAAAVGSMAAKRENPGVIGFIGGSTEIGRAFVAEMAPDLPWLRMGTMPHALIGYARGSTLEATRLFLEHTDIRGVTVLVDFEGREVSDAVAISTAWKDGSFPPELVAGRTLSFRLDTHGGRYLEGLDSSIGLSLLAEHLNVEPGAVVGVVRDRLGLPTGESERVAAVLYGPGMSAAAALFFRAALDRVGHADAGIVVSSGFDLFKCQAFAAVGADRVIKGVGSGSFMPAGLSETYATADVFMYDGVFCVKEGREALFRPWASQD
jgi:nicotinate phosphoribosyltransferase